MSRQAPDIAPEGSLLRVNLIGDRVARLRRHRFLARIGEMASVGMLAAAVLLFLVTFMHLTSLMRVKIGMMRLTSELEGERLVCSELDAQRQQAAEKIGFFSPLTPVAHARVPWAPKLAAVAEALPKGMGIHKIDVMSGRLFPSAPGQTGGRSRTGASKAPHLAFSVVYMPAAGRSEDPMGDLRGNLQRSKAFMDKMDFVRLEATAEETWNGVQVQIFRGLLKGSGPRDET